MRYIDMRLRQIAAEQGVGASPSGAPKLPGPPAGRYKPRIKRGQSCVQQAAK